MSTSRIVLASAFGVVATLTLMPPATAQTASPPGFGSCGGGPFSDWNIAREAPAAPGALRGTDQRYIDKIIRDNSRWEHIRYDARTNDYSRIACTPPAAPTPSPIFPPAGGSGSGGEARVTGPNYRETWSFGGGVQYTPVVTVGRPAPCVGADSGPCHDR